MLKKFLLPLCFLFFLQSTSFCREVVSDDLIKIDAVFQHASVVPNSPSSLRFDISLADEWHFYADASTAPSGMALSVTANGEGVIFSQPVFPQPIDYSDEVSGRQQKVYSSSFSIFIPFTVSEKLSSDANITVSVKGLSCSAQLCRPVDYNFATTVAVSSLADMSRPVFVFPLASDSLSTPASNSSSKAELNSDLKLKTSPAIALPLAILAGLLLNVMPCVWPVLPIIVMRLVSASGQSRRKALAFGLWFAAGILLFFIALAAVNIILKFSFGMIFQWGDQFRNTSFVIALSLLMVVLAMYMFGLFTFSLPSSVSSASGKNSNTVFGTVSTGFLAAVLSTPCSFAILTFVLAWAQTQPVLLATFAILLIGVGMALPYIILTNIPALLSKIPKPGRWMELFKHLAGFILLAIAVKLLEAVPSGRVISVLYYAVVLAVCFWAWGCLVQYNTPKLKKITIRFTAITVAILFGFVFLVSPKTDLIDWQGYDAEIIQQARDSSRPVLIKFTADWCFSCKLLDKMVYSDSRIAELISENNVLAVKADTTDYNSAASIALKEIYHQPAVPVSILLLPDTAQPVILAGNLIKPKLLGYLEQLKD